jgi:hypothetical protein
MSRGAPVVLGLALLVAPRPAAGCDWLPPTIREEAAQAGTRLLLIGTIHDRPGAADASDLHVTEVLRRDPILGDRKVIPLSRWVPSDPKKPRRFLVFCDVVKDEIDAYRGTPIPSDQGLEYVKKVLALDPNDTAGNLPFYFRYLDNADHTIADDAFLEFARANYKDVVQAAPRLDPARLRTWLRDPTKTPPGRTGLFSLLLGHCGNDEDAETLRKLLDDPRQPSSDLGAILPAYVMLKPKEGWAYLRDLFKDEKKPFPLRYAGLRTARFLVDFRPDLVGRKEASDGVVPMIEHEDLADFVIDDLRKWQRWDLTDRVLALQGKAVYKGQAVRRAMLRFALCCKDNKEAERFLSEQHAKDPELVREVKDLLKLEQTPDLKLPPPMPWDQ